MGFQPGCSICPSANQTRLVQLIMKEYITFPILLSNLKFSEIASAAHYILFKDFERPLLFYENTTDLGILKNAIQKLYEPHDGNYWLVNNSRMGLKQNDTIKEPYICSSLRNLLLYFPGCISVDESGYRIFLSDSNHHRIIICDGDGKIHDCIGSSPGFEDGEFESAKLMRPAASFYHASEDCLYFVDSENNAIRQADMRRRVLETLYPSGSTSKKFGSIWNWIMDKFGMSSNVDSNSEDIDSESLVLPWHLMKSADNHLLIINRSFETLWILDMASGEIKKVIKGLPKILEIGGPIIMDKISILKGMPGDWLHQQVDGDYSLLGIPHAGLVSAVATLRGCVIMCDMGGQRLLKFCLESGVSSNFQLSNFGILGLPYWFAVSLERVYAVSSNVHVGARADHIQCLSLLPGRIDLRLTVEIPSDTELVEPVGEGCIWRQARGAATEATRVESLVASKDKVGVAQQWYDELDSLAFSMDDTQLAEEVNATSNKNFHKDRVSIDCAINSSPGTSEVIIYAPLYLKLKRNSNPHGHNREKIAARINDILSPQREGCIERESCIQFLLTLNGDLEDIVFVRSLHVRVKLDCLDHPKADNSRDIIFTNSSIDVNVSLNS